MAGISYYTYNRDSTKDIIVNNTKHISQLSDGTNTYVIKDAEARTDLSGKQDTLVSGTNIKTINNSSILGSGNLTVNPSVDNSTIVINGSSNLQANGTVNKNTATGAISTLYDWVGTKTEYTTQNIATLHPEWVCFITDETTPTRNIGEIIISTVPLSDAGLHLCDGSVLSGDGIYGEFVSYMADLYGDGTNIPDYFDTEVNWQASVTNYGVCGKFVYTTASGNNPATIRLPKITGFIEGTNTLTTIGDLVEAGLPNITGTAGIQVNNLGTTQGAFTQTANQNVVQGSSTGLNNNLTFDASESNSIYGNSATVQPQAIKVLYYIVVATETKTEVEIDIDDVASDLNGKLETDLTNVDSSGKSKIAEYAMPGDNYVALTPAAHEALLVTAPANGYVTIMGTTVSSPSAVGFIVCESTSTSSSDKQKLNQIVWCHAGVSNGLATYVPVKKGDKVYQIAIAYSTLYVRFVYAEGEI